MVAPAIAPYVPTYATYTPYITADEFLAAPTGVDVSQLIPSGSNITQAAALEDLIRRGSGQADIIVQKTLAATADVVADEYRIMPDGQIWVPVDYTPLIAVTGVQIGYAPNQMQALPDLSGVWLRRKVAKIPLGGLGLQAPNQVPTVAYPRHGRVYGIVNYVNGWAHTTIAAAAQGASSITPKSVVGFVPNLPFTIKDGALTEDAVVAPTYVYGSASVPLVSPLQNAHADGTTASALPPAVKDAVIDLCKWLVKQRGSKGLAMGTVKGQPLTTANAKTQQSDPGGAGDYKAAKATLLSLRRAR